MFLRSLTLKGFKSFAEATTLELEPGLTVVVGPNGSGKSNIVDAVAWVLGAQGPRTVRSSRMEDVIFAGNGRRPALGRAEVTLTIDNSTGLLPIGFSEVTLTRTLFRSSGESEYAINGVPCRLLDLQELLSDTGVGRQQHVIVSQGNLEQVLDVRPEDRRLIIEEAAGILKFRRRKEKAARRLESTEAHLVRLNDLLREQRRQMRPLERQAEAARRHDALASELRALRVYLAGRAVAALEARAEAGARERDRWAAAEAAAQTELRRLDDQASALETQLGLVEPRELDGAIARLHALRERARGVGAVLSERARALDAELTAGDDGGDAVQLLEAEAHSLARELSATDEEASTLSSAVRGMAGRQAELVLRRRALAAREAAEAAAQQAAETRGRLAALRAAAERGRAELADLERAAQAAEAQASDRAYLLHRSRAALDQVEERARVLRAAAYETSRRLAAAEAASASAAATTASAERRRDEMRARVEALTLALGPPAPDPSEGRGILGVLLDVVEIDPGWEPAVEAALGEALAALVVESPEAARALLAAGAEGTLLVIPPPRSGEATSTGLQAPPAAGEPLRPRVRSTRPEVSALLDRLLVSAVTAEGWEAAIDLALAHPQLVVVSRHGDRFSRTGWRRGGSAPGAGVAAALGEARGALAEAEADAASARAAEEVQRRDAEAVKAQLEEEQARVHQAEEAAAGQRTAVAALDAEHRAAAVEAATIRNHLAARQRQLAVEDEQAVALDDRLFQLTELPGPASPTAATTDLATERRQVAEQAQALAARKAQLTAQSDAVARRRADLVRRLSDVETQVQRARERETARQARTGRARTYLSRIRRLDEALGRTRHRIDLQLDDLGDRRDQLAERTRAVAAELEDVRRRRNEAERQLEEARARLRRAELEDAETRLRLETATETLRRDFECEPEVAVAAECPPLPPGASPANRARELERELRLLGPVNPLAVEELAALEERHAFLSAQLEDVKATRRDLSAIIRSVEGEMTELLAAAYADVAENFADLFETLFPGGEGRLRLTDPNRLLEAGIEIEARPGGKSARKLSLLSGGERSLCALAFLFAVFRSRPSPFYLLDEVEAALDDVNLHRFLRLLDEFRRDTQLLVVTHQKRTMEAADCLFGVTMQPGGTSRVLSERVAVRS